MYRLESMEFLQQRRPITTLQHTAFTSTEEECITFCIPPPSLAVVSTRVELLPDARRKDMFVPLVPPPVHYLGENRVVICAFKTEQVFCRRNAGICTFRGCRGGF